MNQWDNLLASLSVTHLPWLVLTMLVYMAAMAIYRKSGNRPLLIPVFTGVVVIVATHEMHPGPVVVPAAARGSSGTPSGSNEAVRQRD